VAEGAITCPHKMRILLGALVSLANAHTTTNLQVEHQVNPNTTAELTLPKSSSFTGSFNTRIQTLVPDLYEFTIK
jgi:hypothetical protein